MSETETGTAPVIENFSVKLGQQINGAPSWDITFGRRTANVQPIDLATSWDLMELGSSEHQNDNWLGIATIAASATAVDGSPLFPLGEGKRMRPAIRDRLNKLKPDGLTAVAAALKEIGKQDAPADVMDAAKN